ncbi:hypothetical protein BGX23_008015 [Mortierella sp. AD031]|nr:hypothetical protein BGX23_008015 [Mortierella sp. AD031]
MPDSKPKVLIVGAGVGGVMLGLLLHKAGIPFDIYERATTVKPLGLFDEIVAMSKHTLSIQVGNENREIEFTMDFRRQKELVGSTGFMVERHRFYDLLIHQIPKERLHMGKKIINTIEMAKGIRIEFADRTIAEGDILVGADGAYSTVRQNLYSRLREEKRLLASDDVPLPYSSVALWVFVTTAQNTVCWMVVKYLDEEMSKEIEGGRNEEWGPEATKAMCEEVKDFPIITGGNKPLTMGDLIEWSPKEYVSKVMLEEKVFDTWYDGRTVLLGDACHKLNPAGGAGATNAILDVITLSNWIVALPPNASVRDIEDAFEAYKTERLPLVQQAAASSLIFKTMTEMILARTLSNRSQVSFLPLAEDKGTIRPLQQPSLAKTLKILEARQKHAEASCVALG